MQTSSPRCRRSRPSPAGPATAAAGTRPRPAGHRRRVENLPVVTCCLLYSRLLILSRITYSFGAKYCNRKNLTDTDANHLAGSRIFFLHYKSNIFLILMKELALGFTLPTHSHSNDCGDLQTSFTQGGGRSTQIDSRGLVSISIVILHTAHRSSTRRRLLC